MEQQETHFLFITKLGWLGLSVPPSNKFMQLIFQPIDLFNKSVRLDPETVG